MYCQYGVCDIGVRWENAGFRRKGDSEPRPWEKAIDIFQIFFRVWKDIDTIYSNPLSFFKNLDFFRTTCLTSRRGCGLGTPNPWQKNPYRKISNPSKKKNFQFVFTISFLVYFFCDFRSHFVECVVGKVFSGPPHSCYCFLWQAHVFCRFLQENTVTCA